MVLSWIVSPILSGIIVAIMYGLIRTFVLRSKHSFSRAFYVSPPRLPICTGLWLLVIRRALHTTQHQQKVHCGDMGNLAWSLFEFSSARAPHGVSYLRHWQRVVLSGFLPCQCACPSMSRLQRDSSPCIGRSAVRRMIVLAHRCACCVQLLPFLVALTLFVITVFIIQTGAKNKQ